MSKTIVITGASSGIGANAAGRLAADGWNVAVVGRNPERTRAVAESVGGTAFLADYDRLDEVRELAASLADRYERIDVLANNAGGLIHARGLSADGHERTLQHNHLAPFLLTSLLRERLAGGRVISTASEAHRQGRLEFDFAGTDAGWRSYRAYGGSKGANILFAAEAARRWPEITSVSFHPGVVRTNFGTGAALRFFYRFTPFLVAPEKAGALLVWLADTPDLVDGAYYVRHKVTQPAPYTKDPDNAAKLWKASAAAVGL